MNDLLSLADIATIKVALGIARLQFPHDERYAKTFKRVSVQFALSVATSTTAEIIEASRLPVLTRRQA